MVLKIAVCDDDSAQLEILTAMIAERSGKFSHTCEVRTFPSAEAFLFAREDDSAYDILLLDVEMKEISGIDLAKRIRAEGSRAEIIFITSHFEFAGEGYEVDALHYLIKPVSADKLMSVLERAAEKLDAEPPSVIVICESGTVKLYERDIVSVEAFLHYISVRTSGGEYRVKESITSFAEKLSSSFYRTHRSYLVNLNHVIRISRTSVTTDTGEEIPLARGKYDDINRAFIENN